MTHFVAILPAQQLAPHVKAYRDAVAAKRRQAALAAAVLVAALLAAGHAAEVAPAVLWAKIGNFTSYFERLAHLDTGALVWTDPAEWFWGLRKWLRLLGETLLMAYVGTLTGAVGAFAVCFLCAPNLMPFAVVRSVTRRMLEVCRTVPDMVFALIFVVAFGLGPLPGVMAIAIHTMGALGKLFTEVAENIDHKPIDGVAAAGGGWFARVRFGAVPQVLASFVSYTLLRFEVNVRGAAVLGFVGAGGIGEELITAIRKFYYSDVSAILLLVVLCVMVIDLLTERVRHRLANAEGAR